MRKESRAPAHGKRAIIVNSSQNDMDEPTSTSPSWRPLSLLRDIAISVVLAIILIVFIYQPVKVEGTSMMPALTDQERIFINKFTYRFGSGNIERGDMIVFWFPLDRTKSYIKRVVGLPGDTVMIDHGKVYVNGAALDEPYVPREYRDGQSKSPETVPPDNYFVLGDHR